MNINMKRPIQIYLCVLVYLLWPLHSVHGKVKAGSPTKASSPRVGPTTSTTIRLGKREKALAFSNRRSGYDRFLESVFLNADADKDGRMTLTETYEWVLRLYVQLNRQAPIRAPTKAQVQRIMAVMDTNHNNSIGQEEFRELAEFLIGRATVRVLVGKVVKMVVAPLTAEFLLRWLQKQSWLYEAVVEPCVSERLVPLVTNPVIGRTLLMIVTMVTLGGFVMEVVNDLLDSQVDRREAQELLAAKARSERGAKNKRKKPSSN